MLRKNVYILMLLLTILILNAFSEINIKLRYVSVLPMRNIVDMVLVSDKSLGDSIKIKIEKINGNINGTLGDQYMQFFLTDNYKILKYRHNFGETDGAANSGKAKITITGKDIFQNSFTIVDTLNVNME